MIISAKIVRLGMRLFTTSVWDVIIGSCSETCQYLRISKFSDIQAVINNTISRAASRIRAALSLCVDVGYLDEIPDLRRVLATDPNPQRCLFLHLI